MDSNDSIGILLVDDNLRFAEVAARYLSSQPGFRVIGQAESAEEALLQAALLDPQVVLLDLAMPGMGGLRALPDLRRILPDAVLVVLTMLDTAAYREQASSLGADALVAKRRMSEELMPVLRRALAHRAAQQGREGGGPTASPPSEERESSQATEGGPSD